MTVPQTTIGLVLDGVDPDAGALETLVCHAGWDRITPAAQCHAITDGAARAERKG
jgi:hypothetical protein